MRPLGDFSPFFFLRHVEAEQDPEADPSQTIQFTFNLSLSHLRDCSGSCLQDVRNWVKINRFWFATVSKLYIIHDWAVQRNRIVLQWIA